MGKALTTEKEALATEKKAMGRAPAAERRASATSTPLPSPSSVSSISSPPLARGAVLLLLGPVQLIGEIRAKAPAVHRWIGRVYAFAAFAAGGVVTVHALARGAGGAAGTWTQRAVLNGSSMLPNRDPAGGWLDAAGGAASGGIKRHEARRKRSSTGSPAMAVSTGKVIRCSASKGEKPGASVLICTWTLVMSGTASIGSRVSCQTPTAEMIDDYCATQNRLAELFSAPPHQEQELERIGDVLVLEAAGAA